MSLLTDNINQSNLNDILAFIHVVNAGSFTLAAQSLNTSKSVISKYVNRLENRLGVKLLNRTTRSLKLTEAGQLFFELAYDGIDSISKAEEEVTQFQKIPKGRLKINAPFSFGTLHIAPVIGKFIANFPEIKVDMRFSDLKIDTIDKGFDITIRVASKLEGNYTARKLAPCRHVLVCSPDYIQRNGLPEAPDAIHQHNLITFHHQSKLWKFSGDKNYQEAINGDIQMDNSLAIREAVLAGAGIARMPTFVVGEDILNGSLIQILPEYKLLELSAYIIFPSKINISPKVRSFVDFIVQEFGDEPDWDAF